MPVTVTTDEATEIVAGVAAVTVGSVGVTVTDVLVVGTVPQRTVTIWAVSDEIPGALQLMDVEVYTYEVGTQTTDELPNSTTQPDAKFVPVTTTSPPEGLIVVGEMAVMVGAPMATVADELAAWALHVTPTAALAMPVRSLLVVQMIDVEETTVVYRQFLELIEAMHPFDPAWAKFVPVMLTSWKAAVVMDAGTAAETVGMAAVTF